MDDLAQRYRGPSAAQRVVALVVIAMLVLSGVGFLTWTVWFNSNPKVTSTLEGFSFPGDGEHLATATFTVSRESESTQASCRLQALATDHSVVGEVAVPVTDGPRTRRLQVEIRTSRAATSVDLLGCTADGQDRPR